MRAKGAAYKRKMLVGACAYESGAALRPSLSTQNAQYGRLGIYRDFASGTTPPTITNTNQAWCVSWKGTPTQWTGGTTYDTALANWAAALPTNGTPIYWCWYHEPSDNIKSGSFTVAQYKAAWQKIHGIIAANKPSGARAIATPIWHSYLFDSRNTFGHTAEELYPGDAYVDCIGIDADAIAPNNVDYGIGSSNDPKLAALGESRGTVLSTVWDWASARGKSWMLAEFGTSRHASDTTGAGRVAWSQHYMAIARKRGCEAVCLYDNEGVLGALEPLHTTAELDYWRSECLL